MNFSVIVNYNTKSLKSRAAPSKTPQQQMNSRFNQLTKVLISLSVLLMFTAALIAGQVRANLPAEVSAAQNFAGATRMSMILESESLRRIDSLSHVVDIILALPIDVELGISVLTPRTGSAEDAGFDDSSVQ